MNMELNDWLAITDGRVTEGSEFGFDCYGDRTYTLSYWNGLHGEVEVSSHVVYNRDTFEVYEAEAFDGAKNKMYVWRDPRYATLYETELHSKNPDYEADWDETQLETIDDFIDKATAIVNGTEYDSRVQVELNMDRDELFALMTFAHERDITFNELIDLGLRQVLDAELDKGEQAAAIKESAEKYGTAWPFNFQQQRTQVVWTPESEDFIGIWNTIKEFELIDADYGQFTGGVVSHTYETPVYTYEVIWYQGDNTDVLPDEITRVNK